MITLIQGLDPFIAGMVVSAMCVMGFDVYYSNKESHSNITFAAFCIAAALWGVTNYLSYNVRLEYALWVIRGVLASGLLLMIMLAAFLQTFPRTKVTPLTPFYKWLMWAALFALLIPISPWVVQSLIITNGAVTGIVPGMLMPVFGLFVLICGGTAAAGMYRSLRAKSSIEPGERNPTMLVAVGIIITVILVLIFNFIFPAFLNDSVLVPYGAVFLTPFIFFAGFALSDKKFLNAQAFTVGLLVVLLTGSVLVELFSSSSIFTFILRVAEFITVLLAGILILRGIIKDALYREQIEMLAADLKQKNVELVELDHKRLEFLSFATHQLRSPLTSIRGFASMLLEMHQQDVVGEARTWVSNIFESSTVMVQTIEDFLNTSRIDSGELKYTFTKQDVLLIVNEVAKQYKPIAERKGLSFTYVVNGGTEAVMNADAEKIRHVVTNLIDNAIKYTKEGWIKLVVNISDTTIEIRTDDSGAGLKPDLIGRLFQRWSRLEQKNITGIKGTGLGLFIVREMVVAHGGTVRAESAGEGKGSSFIADFPRNFVPPATPAAPDAAQQQPAQKA